MRDGYLEDALELYLHANKRDPQCLIAIVSLGTVYFFLDDFHNSERMYLQGLEIEPDNADILASLGVIYAKHVGYREGIVYHERALSIDSRLPMSHWALGESYYRLREPEMALQHLNKFIEMAPGSVQVDEAKRAIEDIINNAPLD